MEQVFPCFSALKHQTYHPKHRHAHLNRIGRVMERLKNLEVIIQKTLKDQHDGLTNDHQTGIRIALICKDIPEFAEIIRKEDYFHHLKQLYPTLQKAIETAQQLVIQNRILFGCATTDDWNNEDQLERIAGEIGTLAHLDATLIFTCAILDYGNTEHYQQDQWDKTFSLYLELQEHMTK
jgi:hypothetical protein